MESAYPCPPAILAEIARARESIATLGVAEERLVRALEAAEVVGAITEDVQLARAVVARGALAEGRASTESIAAALDPETARLGEELARFAAVGAGQRWSGEQALAPAQAEALRKMLLAVVRDPRLVVARIAEHLIELRGAKHGTSEERERLAQASRAVFAPLANRLGIWQLKWELEDLAFRYLDPAEYRRIAAALNERRSDRERYIRELCEELRAELARAGVTAEVYGRPKHIFSIYRKMLRKQLAFEQLFDVRALRVVVATVPECYAALGVVHGRWPYIPGEFDDYIATPKDNDYRSIHTAVIGPEEKPVEVQIRTREMHEQAELGVAAHWRYKEGRRDARYDRKIEWVRRLLEPGELAEGDRDFLERVRSELFEDRVYALTPRGEVIDLPRGATPLDFAYHVHTELGHRCRGAKVNGRIVPLDRPLANGEVVEIILGKQPQPSRDWLAPEQGFLVSPRSRAKVRAWFRRQNEGDNRAAGRAIAERELSRLGAGPELIAALVQELKVKDAERLYLLLGEGDLGVTQLVQALERLLAPRAPPPAPTRRAARPGRSTSPVAVEGVGDLPTTLARCCRPVPPQAIAGYVTLGRGVTVHREDCASLAHMSAQHPERVLQVEWTGSADRSFPVEVTARAYDRRGLVRDLSEIVAGEKLGIEAMTTTTDRAEGTAKVVIRVAVRDLEQLARLLRRLSAVPNVFETRRTN